MALPIDATPKGAAANSNLTVAEADSFLLDRRLWAPEWDAATTLNKEKALMWATALLDVAYEWHGSPTTIEQKLRWPRVGIHDPDGQWFDQDVIPEPIKWGTAEFALALLKKDRTKESALQGLGFESATVGPISVSVGSGTAQTVIDLIPPHVRQVLDLYGTAAGASVGGMQELPLVRV